MIEQYHYPHKKGSFVANGPSNDVHYVKKDTFVTFLALEVLFQESSLPAKCIQQGRKLLSIAGLPMPIPSTRNHLILLPGVFNMARILLGNAGPPLVFPSPVIILFFARAPLTRTGLC